MYAETSTLCKVDQKYFGSYEMLCWRRTEISHTDRVRNEEGLRRGKEDRNVLHTIKRRKGNWISHMFRNGLLEQVVEGKVEGRREITGRRGRRRKQLQDDVKEMRRYWKLKEVVLYHTLWRTGFGRGYEIGVRQSGRGMI